MILTTPLDVTARLIDDLAPGPAAEMAGVDYATVALVALAVPRPAIDRPLDGSGFLVAQPEGLLLTACSWASSKWAHLADPERRPAARPRSGGPTTRRAADLDDDDLVDAVLADLAPRWASGRPADGRASPAGRGRCPSSTSGHLDRVRAWQRRSWPSGVRGWWWPAPGVLGLGIPACIGQGRAAARSVLASSAGGPIG